MSNKATFPVVGCPPSRWQSDDLSPRWRGLRLSWRLHKEVLWCLYAIYYNCLIRGGFQKKKNLYLGFWPKLIWPPPPPLILGPLNRWKKIISNLESTGPEQCFSLWDPHQIDNGSGTKLPCCVSTLVGIHYIKCDFWNKASLQGE